MGYFDPYERLSITGRLIVYLGAWRLAWDVPANDIGSLRHVPTTAIILQEL